MNIEPTHEIVFSRLPQAQKERFYEILCRGNYSFKYEREMFVAEFQLSPEVQEKASNISKQSSMLCKTEDFGRKTPLTTFAPLNENLSVSQLVPHAGETRVDAFSPVEPEKSYVRPTKPVKRHDNTRSPTVEQAQPKPAIQLDLAPAPAALVQPAHEQHAPLLISNVGDDCQLSKPAPAQLPPETAQAIIQKSTPRKMSTVFAEIDRIFPEPRTKRAMDASPAHTTSMSFFEFICAAEEVAVKQPQFAQARFNVSARTLQKALQQPQSAFCLFATNDHLESGTGSGATDKVWSYLEHVNNTSDPLGRAVRWFLTRNAGSGLCEFARIVCECDRQSNKKQLARATFLKVCRDNVRRVQDFVQFVGRNCTFGAFVSVDEAVDAVLRYLSSDDACEAPFAPNSTDTAPQAAPRAPTQLRMPQFYIKAFNEQLMIDEAQFIPLGDAMRLLLPAITQAYSEALLESIVHIPQIYVQKLRDTIAQAIAANIDAVSTRIARLGERSVTVGECYQLCVALVQDAQAVACETAESIITSCGRVNE